MSGIQEKHYGEMKSFIQRNTWLCEEKLENGCKRMHRH